MLLRSLVPSFCLEHVCMSLFKCPLYVLLVEVAAANTKCCSSVASWSKPLGIRLKYLSFPTNMEFGFSLLCWCLKLWKVWLSYLWECFSFHDDSFYWGHEAVLSEERAFPAVCLPDTRHSLPHQWKWALLSPSSELDGNPVSWAFRNSQEEKLHSPWIKSPQILSFWQDQKWKRFKYLHFRKSTERTVLIKLIQPVACLLTLFACIK